MLNLSDALTKARAANETADPWLILLDITLPDDTVIYVARNTEAITYLTNEYVPVGFDLDFGKSEEAEALPSVTLKLFNAPELQEQLDYLEGGVGATVKMSVILYDSENNEPYSEDFSELELYFDVMQVSATKEYVTITLGMSSPAKKRHPKDKYMSSFCRWGFKSVECGYAGVDTACTKTLADCRSKTNSARFGGFPGLDSTGVKIV